MAEASATYQFAPHERPFMPGSPATPDHPLPRRIAYAVIGLFVALTAGMSNGLLLANLPQIQGALGITQAEGAWLTGAYAMTNICTGFVLIKVRQQFGLQRIVRIFLLAFVVLSALQMFAHSFGSELMVRAAAGVIAGGFTPLGFFYIMQALPRKARMAGFIIGLGVSQLALPLSRAISPALLGNGDIQVLAIFEFGLALICYAAITLLPLPPSERAKVFEPLDFLTLALFVPGMALLTAALVQGRVVWWSSAWIGYAFAAASVLIGIAMLIEHNRANPMLNTRWMGSSAIVRFAVAAAAMRILLSEQNYGAVGLLSVVGMGQDQLVALFWIITAASAVGLVVSVVRLNPQDLLRPVLVSIALITVAAFMDSDASNLTRPAQLYFSQALIAFAAIYFIGPTMMSGVLRAISKGPSHMVSFSAVFGISQALGGLVGTALLGTYQYARAQFHLSVLGQSITLADPQVAVRVRQLGGAYARTITDPALQQAQGTALLNQQAVREANILAYNDVFFLVGLIGVAVLVWLGGRWLYYRWKGINPLGAELAAMQAMMAGRQ
ncbi:MFS transporter [Sphingomonas sp. LHG3443-2]|uniref:MFS transporter n=1 Tax=Sphingomonas sp. LHG3443-2 TaxID=2804639 RepID=UPI003CF1ECC1